MSHAGELKRLAEIARPDVGVVTRVAPVHLEFFASVDEIALAKRELIEGLRAAKRRGVECGRSARGAFRAKSRLARGDVWRRRSRRFSRGKD